MTEARDSSKERPAYFGQFRACYVDEAVGRFGGQHEVPLLLELRFREDEQLEIFTSVENTDYRARTLNELVGRLDGLIELRIPRLVPVEYGGAVTVGKFTEVYRPSATNNAFEDTVKAVLEIGSTRLESPWTDLLEDALVELHTAPTPWRFRACISCALSGHPTPYGNSDQLRWCYRDSPDVKRSAQQIRAPEAFSGHYWVRAFHRCSAWRPRNVPDAKRPTP